MNINILFLLTFSVFHNAFGLYFYMGETQRKCFIEEIPDETNVIMAYSVELHGLDPGGGGTMLSSDIALHVEITDPENKIQLSRTYSLKGRISFTSHKSGEHRICMNSNSTAWFSGTQLKVQLEIQVGVGAVNYEEIVKREKLSDVQLRIRQLLDQVEQITKEQNYQRYREEIFRYVSDDTNHVVLWFAVIQAVIVLMMGAWQIRHLKSFFEAKKIV
ncbi:hypothetical protein PPYR_06420 [Photinus pyralis]|uniref:GOLD domain-containing protein n=1 Tax=Photinus pyralis TaxID=7054 RepID=A0A5N4ATL1_PHOPY|nr:transmembrane emp24 domain-containing protein eca-like [Photinus pyralis]KAB0800681.1 hypothetical protein PPYR_06420 [Photinus pyralis]